MLTRIREIEISLLDRISVVEEGQDKQNLRPLKIQVQRVQNLSFLFKNANENQNHELLEARLLKAENVINKAIMVMDAMRDEINYSFLLQLGEGGSLYEALVGMLAMAFSVATLFLNPVVGIGLLAASTAYTAYNLYSFYQEDQEPAEIRAAVTSSLNKETDVESVLFVSNNR
jgi:uncharacterized membrane protein